MNIIGISGYAGSGKDTIADMLCEYDGVIKLALADPIKRFAKEMWGFSKQQLFGPSEYRNKPDLRYPISENNEYLSPRAVLQKVGTEVARLIDSDVWIRYTINVSKTLLTEPGYDYSQMDGLKFVGLSKNKSAVVVSDVRFSNELKYIRQNNGFLIRVFRPEAGLQGCFAAHRSEAEMNDIPDSEFDVVISNTGTLDELKIKVCEFATTLNLKK
jgi:hypothetical protein